MILLVYIFYHPSFNIHSSHASHTTSFFNAILFHMLFLIPKLEYGFIWMKSEFWYAQCSALFSSFIFMKIVDSFVVNVLFDFLSKLELDWFNVHKFSWINENAHQQNENIRKEFGIVVVDIGKWEIFHYKWWMT